MFYAGGGGADSPLPPRLPAISELSYGLPPTLSGLPIAGTAIPTTTASQKIQRISIRPVEHQPHEEIRAFANGNVMHLLDGIGEFGGPNHPHRVRLYRDRGCLFS